MQSVYSAAPANKSTGFLFGKILLLCGYAVGVICSPSQLGHRTRTGLVLLLWRDAVGVFSSPSQQIHRILIWENLTSLRICSWRNLQSQPTRSQDTHWVSLTPLERCSWCILQPQQIGPYSRAKIFLIFTISFCRVL